MVLDRPGSLSLQELSLVPPGPADVVVDVLWSGVSTGTERLLWTGRMPPFPGLAYPLVPGYEAVGTVVEAGATSGRKAGGRVFVPGSTGFREARGLFGAAASRLVVAGVRTVPVDEATGYTACLMALAATACRAMTIDGAAAPPDLIVGHGALGRLLARLTLASGAPPPTVWEVDPRRVQGADGYAVIDPSRDERRDYRRICDVSGQATLLDSLVARLARGGEVVLAGFYDTVSFSFPAAFMKEARLRISAEWSPGDLAGVAELVSQGRLSLDGLVTHRTPAERAREAYDTAFDDPACVKMILDWRTAA